MGEAKVVWTFDMYADKAVGSRPSDACNGSPLIDGDLLYVTTSNGVDRIIGVPIRNDAARRCFAPNAPTLIVLDKRTGRFLAKDTAPPRPTCCMGSGRRHPWEPCKGTSWFSWAEATAPATHSRPSPAYPRIRSL